jgi:DNA-binding MarR family transcriptional regulator
MTTKRISYLIKQVERGARALLDVALRPLEVTTPEYTALSALGHSSGLSSAQLARRSFVSAQAMNQIVVALERRGLIERHAEVRHRKILRTTLTTKGKALLRRCDDATAEAERLLLSELSRKEIAELRRVLNTCAATLSRSQRAPNENAA